MTSQGTDLLNFNADEMSFPFFMNLSDLETPGFLTDYPEGSILSPVDRDENSTETVVVKYEDQSFTTPPPFIPVTPIGPPDTGIIGDPLKFEVNIDGRDTNKKKYLFSAKLRRVYVDMETNFSVSFRWNDNSMPMYVRATTKFADPSFSQKRVERCVQHQYTKTQAQNANTINHVLRSSSAAGTRGVYYCGDPEAPDTWYSVLVEYTTAPDPSGPGWSHAYIFGCKNSCNNGINRRSLEIVFTLENAEGIIYGRETVGVRVCACPRRDMMKDEESKSKEERKNQHPKKRPDDSDNPPPPSKKLRVELVTQSDDSTAYTLPQLQVMGLKTLETGLMVMINMMEMAAAKADADSVESYQKSITEMKAYLTSVKTKAQ